jgi:hypothetical protein
VTINVSVSGADRTLKFDWPAAAASWAETVTPTALAMMRANAPFRTGYLREHISARTEASAGQVMVVLYTTVPYTRFIIGGTRPHVIEPRNAKALRWIAHSGHGGPVFAKRVQHPGTKPDDFPARAIEPLTPMLLSRFTAAVQEAIISE